MHTLPVQLLQSLPPLKSSPEHRPWVTLSLSVTSAHLEKMDYLLNASGMGLPEIHHAFCLALRPHLQGGMVPNLHLDGASSTWVEVNGEHIPLDPDVSRWADRAAKGYVEVPKLLSVRIPRHLLRAHGQSGFTRPDHWDSSQDSPRRGPA